MTIAIISAVAGLGLSATVFFLWRSRKHWKETAKAEAVLRSIEEQKAIITLRQLKNERLLKIKLETALDVIRLRYEKLRKKREVEKQTIIKAAAAAADGNRDELAKLLAEAHQDG